SSRRRHTRSKRDWSSDVCSSDLETEAPYERPALSKKLWLDDEFEEEDTKIGAEEEENVEFVFEREVIKITPEDKSVTLENGDVEIGRATCRERERNREEEGVDKE